MRGDGGQEAAAAAAGARNTHKREAHLMGAKVDVARVEDDIVVGVADGVTIPVVEGTELPTRFWAETVTEYVRPFVRPVTVNDVELEFACVNSVHVAPSLLEYSTV